MMWLNWWQDADWIVRGVFLLLITLSAVSWSVLTARALRFARVLERERGLLDALRDVVASTSINTPSTRLLTQRDLYHALSAEGREALRGQTLREIRLELENGLTILATIGNAAPFIGLFGTVWGIMNALHGLGGAALNMEMVTGPVAEALVATAAGLFVAVPAVAGYNYLVRKLRHVMGAVERNALWMTEPELGEL
ncbi:MotA/TolQ/ExbB proton channel family protein [Magnetofaba australis]|uniref:Biopolymer transport protein ExbB n=1 Tax=Magnetofaba australis IT-1 TaxID=1434232 RepID=A0A1Y2K8U8_9PROT|nr:MotA/TolQ/ExbB proton channel family protein [Magnetofaba australis]OSM07102.1 putative MotA/TolQ/ExbB proton channel family protein [Magnetofaba australis IT-1]